MEATEETSELVERLAALDIGKAVLTACIRVPHEGAAGRRRQEVAEYPSNTTALLRLADRMRELGVTRVAMEAASDYGKPVFYQLSSRLRRTRRSPCAGAAPRRVRFLGN
jgi:transposase